MERSLAARLRRRATAVASRAVRRALGPTPDPPRRWHGVEGPELAPLRVVRYGDCGWREVDGGHGRGRRPGYPLVAAELLAERGIGMRFQDVYCRGFGGLPATREELLRHVDGGAPDAVLLQVDLAHATRGLLPVGPALNRLRDLGAHRPQWLARPMYAAVDPLLRRRGRFAFAIPADAAARVDRFLALVAAEWPGARVLTLTPLCRPLRAGVADPEVLERATRTSVERSRAAGVEVLDVRDEVEALRERLGTWRVHGANGFDLRRPGHEVAGRRLADWLLAERALDGRTAGERPRAVSGS